MKIALIGTAPSSIHLAPYDSDEWQIWGCSPGAYGHARNVNAWFELHRYEPGQPWFSEGYCEFLRNAQFPVYMAQPVPEIPNCVPIDVEHLVTKYSPYFFTSSLAWMMAMAIEQNPEAIGLWGVDMSAGEEYGHQKQGCQFFALLASAMGIEVGVPPESDLLRPAPLYGVCETQHGWIKQTARNRELMQRVHDCEQRLKAAQEEMVFLQGAVDDQNYQMQNWFGNIPGMFTAPTVVPAFEQLANQRVAQALQAIAETTSPAAEGVVTLDGPNRPDVIPLNPFPHDGEFATEHDGSTPIMKPTVPFTGGCERK